MCNFYFFCSITITRCSYRSSCKHSINHGRVCAFYQCFDLQLVLIGRIWKHILAWHQASTGLSTRFMYSEKIFISNNLYSTPYCQGCYSKLTWNAPSKIGSVLLCYVYCFHIEIDHWFTHIYIYTISCVFMYHYINLLP